MTDDALDPAALPGLLAEPDRMRVLAAVALGARTVADVVASSGVGERTAAAALRRLQGAGLVEEHGGFAVAYDVLRGLAREARPTFAQGPLAPFVQGDRLVSLPAAASRRRAVLEHVVEASFPVGEQVDEHEVNARLQRWCAGGEVDHVALRRYLVDARLLTRRDGAYWRARDGEPEDLGAGPAYVRAMGLA